MRTETFCAFGALDWTQTRPSLWILGNSARRWVVAARWNSVASGGCAHAAWQARAAAIAVMKYFIRAAPLNNKMLRPGCQVGGALCIPASLAWRSIFSLKDEPEGGGEALGR